MPKVKVAYSTSQPTFSFLAGHDHSQNHEVADCILPNFVDKVSTTHNVECGVGLLTREIGLIID